MTAGCYNQYCIVVDHGTNAETSTSFVWSLWPGAVCVAYQQEAYTTIVHQLTSVKVFIQKRYKRRVPSLALDQGSEVVKHVECVRPHVALGPSGGRARPGPVGKLRFHEAGVVVEDGERSGEGAGAEEGRILVLEGRGCDSCNSVVIV